ncbi:carbamoyltransferase, putative [Babesia caballi]|uniref:Carbamoyltransferase, putative n=1 Tax=Babesia caballi TaxID=5871 RepID=A0AAV4LME1_BABCB|nr:carbamoyltransferase, putative [Babesia caballi]
MEKFPFYGLEPKERLSKLEAHFLKFEQESTKLKIENELKRQKDQLLEAASAQLPDNDVLLKCGDGLLLEVPANRIKEILQKIKDV